MSLDVITAEDYWNAITILEAQEMLIKFKIQDWSQMKDADRKKLFRQVDLMAYPKKQAQGGKKVSNKELMEILTKR